MSDENTDMRGLSRKVREAWKRMVGNWGPDLVRSKYGMRPPADWEAVIDRLDDQQINRAFTVCRYETPSYPPTLGQFEKAARPPHKLAPSGTTQPSLDQQLTEFVATHWNAKNGRLTEQQYCMPWERVYRRVKTFGPAGEEVWSQELVAIDIPQRDGAKGYRITVRDMEMAVAA